MSSFNENIENILCHHENKLTRFLLCNLYQQHYYKQINYYGAESDKICIFCGKIKLNATHRIILNKAIDPNPSENISLQKRKFEKLKDKYQEKMPEILKN